MMSLLLDIKYACRLLFKTPKFTALTLGVLIGGLSISLFTFSFLHTLVYKPLPIPEANTAKVVNVIDDGGSFGLITGFQYTHLKNQTDILEEFGLYADSIIRYSVEQSGKDMSASYVQNGFFEFSRTQPILGRTIQPADSQIGATPVAVISHGFWQQELNGNTSVLSKTLILNGQDTDIIGVMPEGYLFPMNSQIWLPLSESVLTASADDDKKYKAYGRLKEGVSIPQAELTLSQSINQIYQQNVKLYGFPEREKTIKITSFQDSQTNGEGTIIFVFLNTISWLILLLACINVGNLLLVRTIERQKETAIRAAIGARRSRLVGQLMWEGTIVSTIGGVLAILLVGAALDYTEIVFHSWSQEEGAFWWHWGMDMPTLLMGLGFTVVTIFLTGFLPAWHAANQDVNAALRDGTRGAQGKKAGKISRLLVTTQIFIVATLMLIGSVTAFISHKLINLETGDDYTNVMLARITIPVNKYPEQAQQIGVFQELTELIEQHPAVIGAGASTLMVELTVTMENQDYTSEASKPKVDVMTVIGNTETLGIKLVAGRQFNHFDSIGQRKTALISQSMAKRYWPGESPLEKRFKVAVNGNDETVVVVGVVSNRINPTALFSPLDSADEIYLSGLQFISEYQRIFYKTLPDTVNADDIFYKAMYEIDRNIEIRYSAVPGNVNRNKMREVMSLTANVTYGTGFFALLLALIGIYGLTASSVAQRTHEIGIRRAVGARDKDITRLFLKQGARQLIIGLGLALGLFTLLSFSFHKFTEEIFPVYLYFIIALPVATGLSLVVTWAIFTPTKRAIKLEPSVALRYE